MPPRLVHISEVQPIRFAPYQYLVPDRYHNPPFGASLHYYQLQEWDEKVDYAQKWQRTDKVQVQVDANGTAANGRFLRLVDAQGAEWATFTPAVSESVPGNTLKGYDMDTFHFKFSFADVVTIPGVGPGTLPPGRYYLMLELQYQDQASKFSLSEPLDIAEEQPGTILLEYFHTAGNNQDTIFRYGQINARFALRLLGNVGELAPLSTDTTFEDQQYNLTQLSSTPYRGWKMWIGYGSTEAPWMLDKMNRVMSCDSVYIEGVQYVKGDGAKWDVSREPAYPLVQASLDLREADNSASSEDLDLRRLRVFTRPGSGFPYALFSATLGNTQLTSARVFNNAAAENDTVQQIMNNAQFQGVWTYNPTLGTLDYDNAVGEFYTDASSIILPKFFSLGKRVQASTRYTAFELTGYTAVVDWGEGLPDAQGDPNFVSLMPFDHNYIAAANTDALIRVFHADNLQILECYHADITSFGDVVSSTFERITIQSHKITAFNGAILAPCAASLAQLSLAYGGSLVSVFNFGQAYEALTDINFFRCKLISSTVDNLFNTYVANAAALTDGSFNTRGQNPAAPPTAASLTVRNTLTGRDWDVATD